MQKESDMNEESDGGEFDIPMMRTKVGWTTFILVWLAMAIGVGIEYPNADPHYFMSMVFGLVCLVPAYIAGMGVDGCIE